MSLAARLALPIALVLASAAFALKPPAHSDLARPLLLVDGVPMDDPLMGLPWHENLEEAKREAAATGKPILSLRMLGRLDEELSCANSRFFRTVLYSNLAVRRAMTERFVLHWSSERAAPVLTVDFGDGRTLVRTITGNSIHHVLDSRGRVVDGIPGLLGPAGFVRALESAGTVARATTSLEGSMRAAALHGHHREALQRLDVEWAALRASATVPVPERPDGDAAAGLDPAFAGRFRIVSAVSKVAVEGAPTRALLSIASAPLSPPLESWWATLARARASEGSLDEPGRALFLRKHASDPGSWPSSQRGALTHDAEQEALRLFEQRVAEDGLRNEQQLHRKIREWFIADPSTSELETFNRRIYDELFLTPASDPWLGLASPTTYVGIDAALVK